MKKHRHVYVAFDCNSYAANWHGPNLSRMTVLKNKSWKVQRCRVCGKQKP